MDKLHRTPRRYTESPTQTKCWTRCVLHSPKKVWTFTFCFPTRCFRNGSYLSASEKSLPWITEKLGFLSRVHQPILVIPDHVSSAWSQKATSSSFMASKSRAPFITLWLTLWSTAAAGVVPCGACALRRHLSKIHLSQLFSAPKVKHAQGQMCILMRLLLIQFPLALFQPCCARPSSVATLVPTSYRNF